MDKLNKLEESSAAQIAQMGTHYITQDIAALNSKVTLLFESFDAKSSAASKELMEKYEEKTYLLEKKLEEKNEEKLKQVVEEMSLTLINKMTDLFHASFASQFAPLSEETSMTKNVVRSMQFEQINLATELRSLGCEQGCEQVHIERVLS